MNRLLHPFGFLLLISTLFVLIVGCPAGKKDGDPSQKSQDFYELINPGDRELSEDTSEPPSPIQPVLVFLQGTVSIQRQGKALDAEEGLPLEAGDIISTGRDGSAEIAYGSLATLRLLPQTRVSLTGILSRALEQADRDAADITLLAGTVAAKVSKLSVKDEFLVLTPNSAAGVRGTQFVVSYEEPMRTNGTISRTERTLVAVREGSVAVLPKGKLLSSLIDGRQSSPLAGAVVATALALAPKAGPGQEIAVGGRETTAGAREEAALLDSAEAAYGALVRQAEELQAQGTDFEVVQDPAAVLAVPSSEIERSFAALSQALHAILLTEQSRQLLTVLDRMREPGTDNSPLPAGLPERYFVPQGSAGEPKPSLKGQQTTVQNYPGLVYAVPLASTALSGMISRSGDTLFVLDSRGTLYALHQGGKKLWSRSSLITFTALDNTVALVDPQALYLVDAMTGTEGGTYGFDSWQALPQAKPVPIPNGLALATPRGVSILRQENAELLADIPVLGGVIAPLVLADSQLIAVSGQGKLVFIDIKNKRISDELDLNCKFDVLTPRYKDGRVFIATKAGRLVAVDMDTRQTSWDVDLGQEIRSEPEVDGERLYLWVQDKTLLVVSTQNGAPIGKPIRDVDSPPLLSKGRLYWGGSGPSLVVADAATGAILKRSSLPDRVSARPLLVDGTLYLGTSGGKFIRIDLEKL